MMMKHDPFEWSVAFTVSPWDTWFKAMSVQLEIADAMMRLAWTMTPMGMTGAEAPLATPAKRRSAEIVQLPVPKRKPATKPAPKPKAAAAPAPKTKPAAKAKPAAPRKTARTKPAPKAKTPVAAKATAPAAKPAARKAKRAPSKPPQPFKVDE